MGILQIDLPYNKKGYFQLACDTAHRKRTPPMTPDLFNHEIDSKVFTSGRVDRDRIVKPRYAQAFREIIEAATELKFSDLGWQDAQADMLLSVVHGHCQSLRHLDLSMN